MTEAEQFSLFRTVFDGDPFRQEALNRAADAKPVESTLALFVMRRQLEVEGLRERIAELEFDLGKAQDHAAHLEHRLTEFASKETDPDWLKNLSSG